MVSKLKRRLPNLRGGALTYALLSIVIIEVILIAYINFTVPVDYIDKDFAKLAKHIVEMGDNRRIFLLDWNYLTTAEFDCTGLPALFFYIITGDILKSFAIGNILNIILTIFVVWRLLSKANIETHFKLLGLATVLCIYDYGMLQYTNMLFYCGGQYIYKALLPLMCLTLLASTNIKDKWNILEFVLFSFIYFVSNISSGIYVFMCGIFPIFVCQFVVLLYEKRIKLFHLLFAVWTLLLTVVGLYVCKIYNINPMSSVAYIIDTNDPISAFIVVCEDAINLINPFYSGGVKVVSFGGVFTCAKWAVIAMICVGLVATPKIFGIALHSEKPEEVKQEFIIESSLISIFIWNCFVLFIYGSSERYHLIGILPLMMLSMIEMNKYLKQFTMEMHRLIVTGFGMCLLYISLYNATAGRDLYFDIWKWYYIVDSSNYDKIINLMNEYDVHNMYMVNYDELLELMRLKDPNHSYELYVPSECAVKNFDYYYTDMDRASFSDRNMILTRNADLETLPYYILDNYETIDQIDNCTVLFSEHNPNDGVSYVRKGIKTIDLPTTPGYVVKGTINEKGYLVTSGEEIAEADVLLISNDIEIENGIEVEINYLSDKNLTLNYYKDNVQVDSISMDKNNEKVRIDISESGNYRFEVISQGNTNSVIKEFVFQ